MDQSNVSIIIPVFNAVPWLRGCLDSVCAQTHQQLEILLVDDGSTDGSGAICEEYARADSRIRVIRQENCGVSAARNAGLATASGEWITFVDADDRIEADTIEYYLDLAGKHHADVVQCGVAVEEAATVTVLYCTARSELFSADEERKWFTLANSTCNKLYRRETVQGIRYDENYPIGEDLLFNLQVLKRGATLVCGNQVKYHYVQHADSACHCAPTLQKMTSYRQVLEYALDLFGDHPAAVRYFRMQQLRNDLDICSKIVQFPAPEYKQLRSEIQRELRASCVRFGKMRGLPLKECTKIWLAAWVWWFYRGALLLSKEPE